VLKKYSQVLLTILFFVDVTITGFCWNLAYYLRFYWVQYPELIHNIPPFKAYFNASGIVILCAMLCFVKGKMYEPERFFQFKAEFRAILRSTMALFIILVAVSFFYRKFSYSRAHVLYFLILSLCSITISRLIIRQIFFFIHKKGKNLRRILIIGNGKTAQRFAEKISDKKHRGLGFLVCGIISKDQKGLESFSSIGSYQDISQRIEEHHINQVYIALDSDQQSDLQVINDKLAEQLVDVNIIPDIFHTLNVNPEVLDFDGLPVIALRQSPLNLWDHFFKRAIDILGAVVGILLFLPCWIILPIAIKLTSRGPVFYKQERMGLDGVKFKMIKFRSMKVDAETKTGAVWAKQDDDRKTAMGSFLRRTSLDEIPQFFNVLFGSMSLVGPRPERPVFIDNFKTQIPNYMLRHKMKAGITGWAQINGWRGNTSLEKRIECDIYYLTNWSVWLDIKILFLTLFNGFVHKNAY
jgi:Undecaprenyl-phosphate glucose phosphotransferase